MSKLVFFTIYYINIHHQLEFLRIIRFYIDNFFGRTGPLRTVSGRVYFHFNNRLFPAPIS